MTRYGPGSTVDTPVVGIAYQGRQAVAAALSLGDTLWLVREPNNPHDRNAICVVRDNGDQVGYLPKELAAQVAGLMDHGHVHVAAQVVELTVGRRSDPQPGVVVRFTVPSAAADLVTQGTDMSDNLMLVLKQAAVPRLEYPGASGPDAVSLVSLAWLPDAGIRLFLVVGRAETMVFVTPENLLQWGLTEEAAFARAFANLVRRTDAVECQTTGNHVSAVATLDGYDATRILVPSLRRRFCCEELKVEQCFIGIPNRDFLIAVRPDDIHGVIDQLQRDATTRPYPLTAQMFVTSRQGSLAPLQPAAPGPDWDVIERYAQEAEKAFAQELVSEAVSELSGGSITDAAIRYVVTAITHDPQNPGALRLMGTFSQMVGDLDYAVTCYKGALATEPDPQLHALLGRIYGDQGRTEEAIQEFEAAVALDGSDADIVYDLGVAYGYMRRRDDAIAMYRRTLSLAPDHYRAHHNLGSALWDAGNFLGAKEQFSEAVRLAPESSDAHVNLAMAQRETGDTKGAIRTLRRAIKVGPDDAQAHYYLAVLLSGQDAETEAYEEMRKAARHGHRRAQELLRQENLTW